MTLDDSGWIFTKADFWRREVGECSLSGRAKVPDIKENIYSHQGGAIASKFDGLDDMTGGNCWIAGYLSTSKFDCWSIVCGDSGVFRDISEEANSDE